MYEIIAVTLGAAVGCLIVSAGWQLWHAALGGASAGALATIVSGEIEVSPAFLLFDASQAAVAAILAGALVRRARRGAAGPTAPPNATSAMRNVDSTRRD
jgi:hypothetical protein